MKVQTKSFLSRDMSLLLEKTAQRTRRSKSEIVQAALASYLSADGDEAREAALVRRLDRMGRELERIQRDVTISNEAVALFVKAWLTATPVLSEADQRAQSAKGQERYLGFLDALGRRLSTGKLLRTEIPEEIPGGA